MGLFWNIFISILAVAMTSISIYGVIESWSYIRIPLKIILSTLTAGAVFCLIMMFITMTQGG